MKVIVNGEETEIETRDDLFIKIGDEWYVKTINIEAQILQELEEWLKEQGNNGIDEWGNYYTVCLYKLNELKEKYK